MTKVRTVRPTDLVALVAYDGRVYPNESVTRDRAGTEASPHPLETALEQWFSFATGRHTWISVRGATLRGLVSARRRGTKAAWEIDCLIDAADDDSGVLISLLERVIADAGRSGAEKVFVRVPAGSGVVERVSAAGFVGYLTEHMLARAGGRPAANGDGTQSAPREGAALRRRVRPDAEPLFRLYNRWAPEPVRRIEAVTFREWQAAQERLSPSRGTRQRVIERRGRIAGWLRTAVDGDTGRFDLMADPEEPALLDTLIDAALETLGDSPAVLTLVPGFAAGLRERLERRGFSARDEFVVLARRTARLVKEPKIAATGAAQTAQTSLP
jgi:hypothetical protein